MDERAIKSPGKGRFWVLALIIALLLIGGGVVALHTWYDHNLKPVSSSTQTVYFTVEHGSGVHEIAINLEKAGLIRSVSAFETYVTANNYRDKLQAGTYKLSPSMSAQTIVKKMVNGNVAKDLLTILPGKRLDQIKQAFRSAGFSRAAVEAAFSPANYAGHPALDSLPKHASLEGYLYPDSFQKESSTAATTIIQESLDEMQKYLTPDIKNGFKSQGLTVFQGITLASIVLRETDNSQDQPIVAQVLLSRLKQGMLLQADATAMYGAVKDNIALPADPAAAAAAANIHDSVYNTYKHKGLPPGPISNITKEALYAVAHPAGTDYLYYVTGDDCKTHFSHTQEEHQAAVDKYLKNGCQQ